MTPEEINVIKDLIEETKAGMAQLIPEIRRLRGELSILEKEYTKLSNAHRKAQMSISPVKKIPFGVSSKSKPYFAPSQVVNKMSTKEAAKLLYILERRLST